MKRKIITTILIALLITMLTTTVQASYQSISQSVASNYKSNNIGTWIKNIRNMEAEGQVMGLTETYDADTLLSTSGSNNIDVHLMKNTEWGAMAILSASTEYGKQPSSTDTTAKKTSRYVMSSTGEKSTTGNVYGVYPIGTYDEWTSAGGAGFISKVINERYKNIYDVSSKETKPGDAVLSWHGYGCSFPSVSSYGFLRGHSGVFQRIWCCPY